MRKTKKFVALLAVAAIATTMCMGVVSYFTDYETKELDANAGTLDVSLTESIDLDGTIGIVNPGDVAPFDFTVKNEAEKSADVYAVVTVTGTPVGAATTASPYKLLVNGTEAGFEDAAEVATVAKDGNVYTYTLPLKALVGSVENDADLDGTIGEFKYEYEIGMDIDALNEWQDSTVDVKIEVFAKQHRNTASVAVADADWTSVAVTDNGKGPADK